ncbi:MAG TPA: hypothetical protein VHS28_09205 [Chloroflexota bacterium]|nr:hypothetical protein [Chloroflexota bacterium]
MNRREFELRKQMLWVYLRHQGRCAVCDKEVSREEATTDRGLVVPVDIDELLKLRLMHPRCKAAENSESETRAAA